MKLSIKPKIEATDQFNIRLPLSLKKRLEVLRTRANDHNADFNGTLVAVIEEFASELEGRFDGQDKSASTRPRTNPNKVLAPRSFANGADPEPASGQYPTDKPTV
jgi:hypothetical protein